MTLEEYTELFHRLQLNLIAFRPLYECDEQILELVNVAIKADREYRAIEQALKERNS